MSNNAPGGFTPPTYRTIRADGTGRNFALVVVVAMLAFAFFAILIGTAKSAEPITAKTDRPLLNAPFTSITWTADNKFVELKAQDGEDEVRLALKTGETADFFLHGKPATEAEVQKWAATNVDCRVKVYEDRLEFYGGKIAYNHTKAYAGGSCVGCTCDDCKCKPGVGCPAVGQCFYYGVQPNTLDISPRPTVSQCSNGNCPNVQQGRSRR